MAVSEGSRAISETPHTPAPHTPAPHTPADTSAASGVTEETFPLWSGPAPHGANDDEPYIHAFLPEPRVATGAAMLILPGGCYTFLSEKSGAQYGRWLAEAGIAGFVVHFRLGSRGHRYRAILGDGWQAHRLVTEQAERWSLDPARIGVVGTSAGGHLASLMVSGITATPGKRREAAGRPALGVLCYAVTTFQPPLTHLETRGNFLGDEEGDAELRSWFSGDEQVDDATPPCFIWHTNEDAEVGAEHSLRYAAALRARGRPYELHLYEKGEHALGLARNQGLLWSRECIRWLRSHGFQGAHHEPTG